LPFDNDMLSLVDLQLLLECNDPQTLVTSVQEQQRDHPQEKLYEHPLTPRLGSGTWEVRRGASHSLGTAERTTATTGLDLRRIELALYIHSGMPTGICGVHSGIRSG